MSSKLVLGVAVAAVAAGGGWFLGQASSDRGQPATVVAGALAAGASGAAAAEARPEATQENVKALRALAMKARKAVKGDASPAWEEELPTFTDPPAGARAPVTTLAGVRVGRATPEEARRHFEGLGFVCKDASVRAMMATMRVKKQAELEAKKAAGEGWDGASGASWVNRQTRHEKNPQVRLACEQVDLTRLPDRARGGAQGRVLTTFDSPKHPARRVTINRGHPEMTAATADFTSTLDALAAIYGAPSESIGALPQGIEKLGKYQLVSRKWQFADLHVKLSMLDSGGGPRIAEEIYVPLPVRPDAPAL